jgi:AcrR family transcriptional regulator
MQIQKTDIRKVILEVSRKEFLEHGFKDASMRTIAKKSGVSLGNIYNYFKNKNEIFTQILSVPVSLLNKVNNLFDDEYFIDIENIRNGKIKQLKAGIEWLKKYNNIHSKKVQASEFFIHYLNSSYVNFITEILMHDIHKNEMIEYLKEYFEFFYLGWQGIMKE